MKIAQLTPVFPPYGGGIGVATYNYTKYLTSLNQGIEVDVFTPLYNKKQGHGLTKEIKIHYLHPLLKSGNAAFLPQIFGQLKNFDIIHLHFPFLGGAEIIGLKKFLKPKLKLVITYHMDLVGQGLKKTFFKWYAQYVTPKIINQANKIIVTSFDYLTTSLIAPLYQKCPQKFIEIPLGVDITEFKPQAKDLKLLRQYNLNLNYQIILFVGTLDKAHYFKGLPILLQAVKMIHQDWGSSDTHLMIVGSGNLLAHYQTLVKKLGLSELVIFTGNIEPERLTDYYNLSDIVVLPSIDRSEAFGLVLLEAMACQKPVVASRLAGVRTIVDDSIDGFLVEPENTGDLAQKIKILLSNRDLATHFGERGKAKVEKKYDWRKIIPKIYQLYLEL